jgi:uncharacterized protein (TIGR00369 family)
MSRVDEEEPDSGGRDGDADGPRAGDGPAGFDGNEALEAALREHELFRWLDLAVATVEPGRVAFHLPFDETFANISSGTVHGGTTATVIDTASEFALRSTFDDPAAADLTTTDVNVRYLRPARGDLRVEAEVVRAGESMGVTEAEATTVHEDERTVIATGGTTYRLFRGDGDE